MCVCVCLRANSSGTIFLIYCFSDSSLRFVLAQINDWTNAEEFSREVGTRMQINIHEYVSFLLSVHSISFNILIFSSLYGYFFPRLGTVFYIGSTTNRTTNNYLFIVTIDWTPFNLILFHSKFSSHVVLVLVITFCVWRILDNGKCQSDFFFAAFFHSSIHSVIRAYLVFALFFRSSFVINW